MSCVFELKQCNSYWKTGFYRIIKGYWYTKKVIIFIQHFLTNLLQINSNINLICYDLRRRNQSMNSISEVEIEKYKDIFKVINSYKTNVH